MQFKINTISQNAEYNLENLNIHIIINNILELTLF